MHFLFLLSLWSLAYGTTARMVPDAMLPHARRAMHQDEPARVVKRSPFSQNANATSMKPHPTPYCFQLTPSQDLLLTGRPSPKSISTSASRTPATFQLMRASPTAARYGSGSSPRKILPPRRRLSFGSMYVSRISTGAL